MDEKKQVAVVTDEELAGFDAAMDEIADTEKNKVLVVITEEEMAEFEALEQRNEANIKLGKKVMIEKLKIEVEKAELRDKLHEKYPITKGRDLFLDRTTREIVGKDD